MLHRLILPLVIALLPGLAFAGDFKDQQYTSRLGYKLKVPESWTRVDASTLQAMKTNLPKNIDEQALSRFDVIFFPAFSDVDTSLEADRNKDPKAQQTLPEPPDFSPSISVLALAQKPSDMSSTIVESYAKTIQTSVTGKLSGLSNFKLVASAAEPLIGGDAHIYQYNFENEGKKLCAKQAILVNKNNAYVITCTLECSSEDICDTVFNSVKF